MTTNILLTLFACACIGAIAGSLFSFYVLAASPVWGGAGGAVAGILVCLVYNATQTKSLNDRADGR